MSSDSPKPSPRTAREVIDAAIRENWRWEVLCFALTVLFATAGIAVLILGAVRDNSLMTAAGAATGALFWPALRYAESIRRTNISIRLLEITLAQAKTEKQAAEAIKDVFLSQFGKGHSNGVAKT